MFLKKLHRDILLEEVRDQLKFMAEAIGTLIKRIESLENRMDTLERVVLDMDARLTHLALEVRELKIEMRERVVVRLDNYEGRIYKLEQRAV